jgi:hypothetical protein
LLNVELNLASSSNEAPQWVPYRLLFVKGTMGDNAATPSKHDWAHRNGGKSYSGNLCVALGIEVYFKENATLVG